MLSVTLRGPAGAGASDSNLVRYAYDLGINYFDTAESYGNGEHERVIGGAMEHMDRKKIFITTKLEIKEEDTEQTLMERYAKCLERLKTPYADALFMHAVSAVDTVKNEAFHAAVAKLKASERLKHGGISCHGPRGEEGDSMEKVLLAAVEDGRFDLMAEDKRYDARLTARDIQLRQWVEQAPSTRLAVEGRVQGIGTDPATLEATFDLTVLRSLVEGARVDSSLLRFTVSDGLAVADTFAIQTDAGRVRGRGSFGLAEETSGSLILDMSAPDLASWNRWVVPGRNPARQDTSLEGLFAAFPGEDEQAAGVAPAGAEASSPWSMLTTAWRSGLSPANL